MRASAAQIVARLRSEGVFLDKLLDDTNPDLEVRDQALLREMCFGVCRWYHLLDGIVGSLVNKPLKSRDFDLHCLLLVGLYQVDILYS